MRDPTLEKVTNKRFEDFPATTLYIDDLSEIADVVSRTCKRLEIEVGEYKITDKSELQEIAERFPDGRFSDIRIEGYDPYVSFDFRSFAVSAYVSDDSIQARGVVSMVRDIVARGKKRKPALLINILSNILVAAGVWQLISKEYVLGLALLLLSLVTIPIAVRYDMKNSVIIHSRRRSEVTTFFQRKKDDVAIAIIAAALGGIVTYVLTKYVLRRLPNSAATSR